MLLYRNDFHCDDQMYWLQVGEDQDWLEVNVGVCVNYPSVSWTNIILPEPEGSRNECIDGTHRCPSLSECLDNEESYTCSCQSGFNVSGLSCSNIDECQTGSHDCASNSSCIDTVGSYYCTCNQGYSGNGTICENINECAIGPYHCPSWSTCIDTEGSYSCMCDSGFRTSYNSYYQSNYCYDINECSENLHNCSENAYCHNTHGSYNCVCQYRFTGNGTFCTPGINCNLGCSEDADCIDDLCNCKSGFEGSGDICNDVDECYQSSHNCSKNAFCSNVKGSFQCACIWPYYGDGYSCTNIVQCQDSCSPHAECIEDICICRPGFEGNGAECKNIDECSEGLHTCSIHARCVDLEGSYKCECNDGYHGNGLACTPSVVCPSGSYLAGGALCLQCPLNTYNGNHRNTLRRCTLCPPGYVTTEIGSQSVSQCTRKLRIFIKILLVHKLCYQRNMISCVLQ